jgi:hypothetical protein
MVLLGKAAVRHFVGGVAPLVEEFFAADRTQEERE